MSENKILLVDGNSLLHRAYHAYPSLTTKDGELVNAVYGFASLLLNALIKIRPTHVAVAWDLKGGTFRHEQYKEYKAGRPEMDKELEDQIGRTKELVAVLNIPQFGIEKYEADDVIATLVDRVEKDKFGKVVILTGDKDSLQLIKENFVEVFLAGKEMVDEKKLMSMFELRPDQIVDLKGLMGDASDNLPGIKGIGKVTAVKLLKQSDSLDGIYAGLDRLEVSNKVRVLLMEGKEQAFECRKLATLERSVPIACSWSDCKLDDYDYDKAVEFFQLLGFKSLVSKLPINKWDSELEEVFK